MVAWLAAGMTVAGDEAAELEGQLVLTGSSTVAPLVLEIGRRFEGLHPGVRVDVQSGGSTRGVLDARRGLADLGMASRDLKAGEADLASHTIAIDGIGLIVHAENPVRRLTEAQVRAIYTGEIENWKELGGRDQRITVVHKSEGRSTLELFLKHFELSNRAVRAHVVIGDNQQGIKTVAGNAGAIGYVSIGTAEYEVRAGSPIRLLPMSGVEATVENVAQGRFPLSRPLNLVSSGAPAGLVLQFLDFAQSAEVDDLIHDQYFVPLHR